MLFQTTAEHEALRKEIRKFAEAEVKPIAFSLDQNNEFPDEIVKAMGKHGWMGLPYPKEYGGAGSMSRAMPLLLKNSPALTAVSALSCRLTPRWARIRLQPRE